GNQESRRELGARSEPEYRPHRAYADQRTSGVGEEHRQGDEKSHQQQTAPDMPVGREMPLIKYQRQDQDEAKAEVVVVRKHAAVRPVNPTAAVQEAPKGAFHAP